MQTTPEVGQLVVVRKRPFVVTEIIPSAVGSGNVSGSAPHLLRLSSVEDDGLGEELRVFWELEPGTSLQENLALPAPTSFDHPKRLQAFLDAVRWGAVSQADDRALQSPFRSGIEVDEYQFREGRAPTEDEWRMTREGRVRDGILEWRGAMRNGEKVWQLTAKAHRQALWGDVAQGFRGGRFPRRARSPNGAWTRRSSVHRYATRGTR
jgi:hypothetical protein